MKNILLSSLLVLASCGQHNTSTRRLLLPETGHQKVLLIGVENPQSIKDQAQRLGIKIEGEKIIILSGDSKALAELRIEANNNFAYLSDAPLIVERPAAFTAEQPGLYLAKKDFGILEFWKSYPEADGRGVIVGVLDDGISPHQSGFKLTTTGERKFLKKGSQSTFTTFDLEETEEGLVAIVDETRESFNGSLDLNGDGLYNTWKIIVDKNEDKACIDDVCKGSFSKTGDYFIAHNPLLTFMVEIDHENKKIQLFGPESDYDSHGEGVASVMAGHMIGNLKGFDGVAPGAQILDYDLSEVTDKAEENEYTIAKFIKGLDWLGSHGAEVVNISYSLGFTSAQTQSFMQKALSEIIKQHNMVVSFSAGNNGPGLGSLNRRSIYPDDVLVAGAFISKELDESVHGVTGIPEEGRVVYYSSRGPAFGIGPTLISPLSNLTHSSANDGHMAFNGTSSASPALAGAATVLISAIKQQGLKVNASTVAHALRLSGRRILNEPFIFQGNGLPQVARALEIYKSLIQGKALQHVSIEVNEKADDVFFKGITLKVSEGRETESRIIYLKGKISELAPNDAKVNLLVPVRLEYSKGISGPRELWVSSGESSFYVDIDLKEMLGLNKTEVFGEINMISQLDHSLIATVPVTLINDMPLQQRPKATLKLSAQEGKRLHVNIPQGVKAFKVKAELLDGDENNIVLSIFNAHQIRMIQKRLGAEIWVPIEQAGHYQVGVSMNGGTKRGAKIQLEVEEIDLQLKSKMAKSEESTLVIQNKSSSSISGILSATRMPEVITSVLVDSNFNGAQEFTKTLSEGDYQVEMIPTEKYDLSYFFSNCSIKEDLDNGQTSYSNWGKLSVQDTTTATFRCIPFDFGMKAKKTIHWQMRLLKNFKAIEARLDHAPKEKKEITLNGLEPGQYLIEVRSPFSKEKINLGKIDVI